MLGEYEFENEEESSEEGESEDEEGEEYDEDEEDEEEDGDEDEDELEDGYKEEGATEGHADFLDLDGERQKIVLDRSTMRFHQIHPLLTRPNNRPAKLM